MATCSKNFEEVYELGDELGRGAFSVVHLATRKSDGACFAAKIIRKKDVTHDMSRVATEMEILKKVKHPNIITLEQIFETPDIIYIVTELVTGGELFDKIVEKGSYTEKEAALLVSKMISAIDYLHSNNIVHRDLKPENLLLKSVEDDSEVKLADFGLSKIIGTTALLQTACGTPGYVAPEVLNATGYDKEVDLWSIGVITYILLCGFPPFYNEELPELFEQIMNAQYDYPEEYWCTVSDEAKNFIDRLLQVDPTQRMTVKEASRHPWLQGNAPNTVLKTVGSQMKSYIGKKQQSYCL